MSLGEIGLVICFLIVLLISMGGWLTNAESKRQHELELKKLESKNES